MEVEAIVRRIEGSAAVIELVRPSEGCGRCHEPGGCGGSGILTQALGPRCREFSVRNHIGAREGDRVWVRMEDGSALRTALMVYLLPIVLMLIGAGAATSLADGMAVDLAALIGAGGGLALAIAAVLIFQRRAAHTPQFTPVLSRRQAV